MTKEIILQTINNANRSGPHLLKFLKNNCPDVLRELLEQTSFLDKAYGGTNYKVPLQARLYCLEHDLTEPPKCQNPDCHSGCTPRWSYGKQQFKKFCGSGCKNAWLSEVSSKDLYRKEIEESCLKKYNARNFWQSDEFKRKSKETCMKLHGVEHISLSKEWREGVKETCRRKYHADSPFESKEIQEKAKQSCLKHNGVENPWYSDEYQTKAHQTIKHNNSGIGFASQKIMAKVSATCEQKYGVKHFTQSYDYHKNKRHKYKSEKYPGLTFDSTWEVKVYEFCRDNNIVVEYSPRISYKYEYDGRTWTYHPDFLINGKVYEVKGDYFFRINESIGQEEMFCPYRETEWSDEYYMWICGKFEAKHQCMIKQDVRILRDADIKNLSNIMFVN